MTIKNILLFVCGLTVGGGAGVLGSRKFFQEKYQKKYEEDRMALEEYYKRTDEYLRKDSEEINPDQNDSKKDSGRRPEGTMSQEEREAIKKKLKENWEGTTNYASMYKVHEKEMEAGPESYEICANCVKYDPETEICSYSGDKTDAAYACEGFENQNYEESEEEKAFDEHRKNMNKPPKIISADAYSNLSASIEQEILYFYAYDETLCDENEEPVEEPERLIGDALTKYGFIDNDERIIFVMNYATDTCYEIQKLDQSWTDSH